MIYPFGIAEKLSIHILPPYKALNTNGADTVYTVEFIIFKNARYQPA